MTYYLLRALADAWHARLAGAALADAYSQQRDELSLAFETAGPGGEAEGTTLRVRCAPGAALAFRVAGGGRARRNTASVFDGLAGARLRAVRVADRDRVLALDFDDGTTLHLHLYGPRPNALRVGAEGAVLDAFLQPDAWRGRPAPPPRPAPEAATAEAFAARWRGDSKTVAQAVARAAPLFDALLAAEAARRAGLDPAALPAVVTPDAQARLFEAVREVEAEQLGPPRPVVYRRGALVEALALVPLAHPPDGWAPEPFADVDAAQTAFAKARLAQSAFEARYRPLEGALAAAADRLARRADAMAAELAAPSRADRYEAFGHLLMALAAADGPGREAVTLPDVLADGAPVAIPLDPALSGVENAQRYYDRARRTRGARADAEARWAATAHDAEAAAALLARLRALDRLPDLRTFFDAEAEALARFTRPEAVGEARSPYRRFVVAGWEILAGKNAATNAALTTRTARPHDLWLHARGVPGAHVVVRRPSRTATPPCAVVEAAARIAAHFSEARPSALVPVQVTERKYVRPLKGAAPGAVRVDREEVLLVEPGLPDA